MKHVRDRGREYWVMEPGDEVHVGEYSEGEGLSVEYSTPNANATPTEPVVSVRGWGDLQVVPFASNIITVKPLS
jgi:hypothetical protein